MTQKDSQAMEEWKTFRAKRKLIFGIVMFHIFAGLFFWFGQYIASPYRLYVTAFWGMSLSFAVYIMVIAAPLMVRKPVAQKD